MVVIIAGKGMLGSAFTVFLNSVGSEFCSITREQLDLVDYDGLLRVLESVDATLIVNCAAIVNINYCESHPEETSVINVELPEVLADYCNRKGVKFVHISTDHYYSGDGFMSHNEDCPVLLLNEYARQKFNAENKVKQSNERALIIRTNILGYNNKSSSFMDWVLRTIKERGVIYGFSDSFISGIDVHSFVSIVFSGSVLSLSGVYNLASKEVYSKFRLIEYVADIVNPEAVVIPTSVNTLDVQRAQTCGLDCSKIIPFVGKELPGLEGVLSNLNLVDKYGEV